MSREIPEVVRAAAGLAATVLDEARKLPETLPGLPVRAIGLAMQTAMKVQQQYSGLVARGDEVFTGIRGEHEPGLATFDDDDDVAPAPGFRDSAFDRAADTPFPVSDESMITDAEVADLPDDPAADAVVAAVEDMADQIEGAQQALDEVAIDDLVDAAPDASATEDAAALDSALLDFDAAKATSGVAVDGSASVDVLTPDGEVATVEGAVTDEGIAAPEGASPTADTATGTANGTANGTATATDEGGTPVAAATAPRADVARSAPIAGYDEFSIAQLRGRLRGYAPSTIEHLLDYEQGTRAREPYLRMLRNRLERVRADGS